MGISSMKILSFLAGMISIPLAFSSQAATANSGSFVENLPPNYTSYAGKLVMGKSCSCSSSSISGAPPGPPPCNTNPCYGSSHTRYGWVYTNVEGINSSFCDQMMETSSGVPPCFQLDGDDAIIISGTVSTIKDVPFYSFTAYQSFTYNSDFSSNYAALGSSVGLSINNANIKKGTNGKYILIVTANTQTLDTVKNALKASGVPNSIINTYLLPASITNVGSSSYPDQLSLLLRITTQSQTERQQAETFVQQTAPETKVAFIKGPGITGDVTWDDIPKWNNQLRSTTVEYDKKFDQKLNALEQAVINSYARKGYTLKASLTQSMTHVDPQECRTTPSYCAYDSPDALYTSFPCDFAPGPLDTLGCDIQIPKDSDDVLMLVGVDHSLVYDKSLAAYLSFESKTSIGSQDGTFSFVGYYTQGSAAQYVSSTNARNLYAVKITRTCGSDPFCVTVPYQGGTPENTGFYTLGRIYLDKVTATGSNPANLIPARLLWFTKSSQ